LAAIDRITNPRVCGEMPRPHRPPAARACALACLLAPALPVLLAPAVAAAEDESPPLSIYGFARLDVLADDSRMSSLEAPAYVMREPEGGQLESALTMTPRLSRVGLSIDRWEIKDDRMFGEGKVEIDFGGGSGANAIRLRHAYASITRAWGNGSSDRSIELLAGQTWDLASPLFPSAQDDTQLRYAGNLGERRPQVRLSANGGMIRAAVAATAPAALASGDGGDGGTDGGDGGAADMMTSARPMVQWLLEIQGRISRGGDRARIGLSGHAARTAVADGSTRSSTSLAAHVYLPLSRQVVVLGEGYFGQNLAALGGGIGHGVSPVTGDGVHALGGWLELALLPTERHMLSVGTSLDVAREDDLERGDRERNGTIYSALRYRPRPALQLGLEHLYWKTSYKDMPRGVANRVDAHFSVFF
jgi:hypothetical protein